MMTTAQRIACEDVSGVECTVRQWRHYILLETAVRLGLECWDRIGQQVARMESLTYDVYVRPEGYTMRTNIVIDDVLMRDALRVTGLKTKREAVEMGLRTLLRLQKQEDVRKFRGKLHWEGNLDEMRNDK